ncbi:MAG: hypothetical protein Q7R35_08300 [Elusimicrobiota bacterium]|nr:hypothetical protein [Elusimicrobiota bacterium]
MLLKVCITWALLLGIILYEIHASFNTYYIDKRVWKLTLHTVLLFIFSVMNLQLGFFVLKMQFDSPQALESLSGYVSSKRIVPAGPKPAAPNKARKTAKK